MFSRWRVRSERGVLAALALLLLCIGAAKVTGLGVTSSPAAASRAAVAPCPGESIKFDAKDFSNSTRIDNNLFPLVPGTRLTFEGRANRGGGLLPHTVVSTITDLTKVINGVRAVIILETDNDDGELEEAELAFFAQDDDGNVWNLGEYPELYDNGLFDGAPSTWLAGLNDAQAGTHMLAKPRIGSGYSQGWAPDVDFLDCAKVIEEVPEVCIPARCYQDVLRIDETAPLVPEDGSQIKHHAPGTGVIQVSTTDDPEGETLVLTRNVRLSAHALARASRRALRLDRHGYRVSEVYRQTPRAERLSNTAE